MKQLVGQLEAVSATYDSVWTIAQVGGEYELTSFTANAFQCVGTGYIDLSGL